MTEREIQGLIERIENGKLSIFTQSQKRKERFVIEIKGLLKDVIEKHKIHINIENIFEWDDSRNSYYGANGNNPTSRVKVSYRITEAGLELIVPGEFFEYNKLTKDEKREIYEKLREHGISVTEDNISHWLRIKYGHDKNKKHSTQIDTEFTAFMEEKRELYEKAIKNEEYVTKEVNRWVERVRELFMLAYSRERSSLKKEKYEKYITGFMPREGIWYPSINVHIDPARETTYFDYECNFGYGLAPSNTYLCLSVYHGEIINIEGEAFNRIREALAKEGILIEISSPNNDGLRILTAKHPEITWEKTSRCYTDYSAYIEEGKAAENIYFLEQDEKDEKFIKDIVYGMQIALEEFASSNEIPRETMLDIVQRSIPMDWKNSRCRIIGDNETIQMVICVNDYNLDKIKETIRRTGKTLERIGITIRSEENERNRGCGNIIIEMSMAVEKSKPEMTFKLKGPTNRNGKNEQ